MSLRKTGGMYNRLDVEVVKTAKKIVELVTLANSSCESGEKCTFLLSASG
jgi:hypothetical protein